MTRRSLLSIAVLLIVSVASSVQASIVELTFSGTYEGDISGPFSYSMTYDTSLDTNTHFFAAGGNLGSSITTHEWYGYSASGVTDVDIQFNGIEFLPTDLDGNKIPQVGVNADLWFDVDLATGATPTLAWLQFSNSESSVSIGLGAIGGDTVEIEDKSYLEMAGMMFPEFGYTSSLTITRSDPDPIPEPASVITWTLLGVVGCIATWWKRRR